ncbi:hypothetical protein C8J57DRAFT_1464294 [Mycena rebaudengoi]|nr:hypothetical protein C8J57DRAFT_1464294 [Mycena rebaudengoi]
MTKLTATSLLFLSPNSPFLALQPVNTNSHRSIAKRAGRQRELTAKIRSRERGQGQGYTDGASARCKAQKYRREIETAKRRFSSDPRCDPWRSTGNCYMPAFVVRHRGGRLERQMVAHRPIILKWPGSQRTIVQIVSEQVEIKPAELSGTFAESACRIDIQLVGHEIGPAQNNSHEQAVVHVTLAVPPPSPLQEYLASMHGKAWQSPKPPQFTTQVQKVYGTGSEQNHREWVQAVGDITSSSVQIQKRFEVTHSSDHSCNEREEESEKIPMSDPNPDSLLSDTTRSRNLSGTLSDIRERIPDLDARILALERALAAAGLERQNLQTRLDVCKYPILTLPIEITFEIFVHFHLTKIAIRRQRHL